MEEFRLGFAQGNREKLDFCREGIKGESDNGTILLPRGITIVMNLQILM